MKTKRRPPLSAAEHDALVTRLREAAKRHGLDVRATRGRHGSHVMILRGRVHLAHYWPRRQTLWIPQTNERQSWPWSGDALGIVQLAVGLANGTTVDTEAIVELAAA